MKENISIILKYEGKDVDNGSMSLEDFIPALQGFASAYGKVSSLKGLDCEHKLRITSIRKGSLEVLLEVWKKIGENSQQLSAIGGLSSGAAAIVLLIIEVIKLIKHVGKQPFHDKINTNNQTVNVTNYNNVSIEFPLEVFKLFKEKIIDQDLYKIVKPLEENKINNTEVIAKYDNKTEKAKVTVTEKPFFDTTLQETTNTKETWITGKFNSLTKSTNRGFFILNDGTRVSYQLTAKKPEDLYHFFVYNGLVQVRCKAYLDENLKVISIDIFEIKKIQLDLFNEKEE